MFFPFELLMKTHRLPRTSFRPLQKSSNNEPARRKKKQEKGDMVQWWVRHNFHLNL
jgi:hypothetical protein